MADKPNISPEEYIARLVELGIWATPDQPIEYAFLAKKPTYLPSEPGFAAFDSGERAMVAGVFAMVSDIVNLTFVQVPDNQMQPGGLNPRIAFYANDYSTAYSGSMDAYRVGGGPEIYGADIRINHARIAQREAQEGLQNFTYYVLIHEILHALGLAHPGPYNGEGFNYDDHAEFFEDTRQYSVMSYWPAAEAGADHNIGSNQYVASTPLLYDIAALQSLYGANMTTRTGDSIYGFNSNLPSGAYNFVNLTPKILAIWDAGGEDTIDLSGYSSASRINLNAGEFSDAGGLTKNIAIAFGVTIENAVGGSGNDTLIGNAVSNILDGGSGADRMYGGLGDDIYFVDNYGDRVNESAGEGDDIVFSSASFTLGDFVESLTLTGTGNNFGYGNGLANMMTGNSGANKLFGLAGNDLLDGGAGSDRLFGGLGDDVYLVDSYNDRAIEAVGEGTDEVRSSANFRLGDNIEALTLTGSAGIWGYGNGGANTLTGNSGANKLFGLAGNDVLDGGGGADRLFGGAGDDGYVIDSYNDRLIEAAGEGIDSAFASVSYRLGDHVEKLTLNGTSNLWVYGNSADNVLSGNSGSNKLYGEAGADTLRGMAGDDLLDGGAGRDVLYGGAGRDTFYFDDGDFAGLTASTCDQIKDWDSSDILRLREVDADSTIAGDQNFTFLGTGAFTGSAGQLRYEQVSGNTYVYGDTDGDGAADFMVRLDGLHVLTNADLVI